MMMQSKTLKIKRLKEEMMMQSKTLANLALNQKKQISKLLMM
jgi:hypothetical protein